jgi:protein tyrosine phosphatase
MRIIRPRLTNILLAYTNDASAIHPSLFRILAESNPSVIDNILIKAVNEGFMPRVLFGLASAFASADQKLLRHDKTELFTRIGDAAVHHYKDIGIIPQFSIENVTNIIAAYNHAKVSAAVLCIVHCSLNIGVILSFLNVFLGSAFSSLSTDWRCTHWNG